MPNQPPPEKQPLPCEGFCPYALEKSEVPLTHRIGRPQRPEIARAADEMVIYNIPSEAFLAYCDQVHNCHHNGTKMELTFKQWWDWWQEDDRWQRRGRGSNNIMMLRRDMRRGFSLDNIYAGTAADKRRQSEAARTVTEKMAAARATFGQRAADRMTHRPAPKAAPLPRAAGHLRECFPRRRGDGGQEDDALALVRARP